MHIAYSVFDARCTVGARSPRSRGLARGTSLAPRRYAAGKELTMLTKLRWMPLALLCMLAACVTTDPGAVKNSNVETCDGDAGPDCEDDEDQEDEDGDGGADEESESDGGADEASDSDGGADDEDDGDGGCDDDDDDDDEDDSSDEDDEDDEADAAMP
jgi:hypothetical protein